MGGKLYTQSKPSRAKPCAYCGERPGKTKDHPIPACLFDILPKTMITVKACGKCNGQKSLYDTYLRDYLVMDVIGSEHPTAQTIFNDKVVRAATRNQSKIARALVEAKDEPVYTQSGLYLGHAPVAEVDVDMITRGIGFIVRGLYYHATEVRFPINCHFEVKRTFFTKINEVIDLFSSLQIHGSFHLSNVASVSYTRAEDPTITLWLLKFYDSVVFTVSTFPSDSALIERTRASHHRPGRNYT